MPENSLGKERIRGKERLIEAAEILVGQHSFDEITIDEIVKAADLSRPAFYYHFSGGKEELRSELVHRGILNDTQTPDTRQEMLCAALRVFARSGVSAATLEDIATEAGVSRGALNWHFRTKEDLLKTIIEQDTSYSQVRQALEEVDKELQKGTSLDDEAILRRLAAGFYDSYSTQSDLARLPFLLLHTHPEAARLIADKIVRGRKNITEYIRRRQNEGIFCKDIDPAFFIQIMAASFTMRAIGRGLNDYLPFNQMPREEAITQLVNLLLYGMVRREQVRGSTIEATEA